MKMGERRSMVCVCRTIGVIDGNRMQKVRGNVRTRSEDYYMREEGCVERLRSGDWDGREGYFCGR